jgi:hypothetical protein
MVSGSISQDAKERRKVQIFIMQTIEDFSCCHPNAPIATKAVTMAPGAIPPTIGNRREQHIQPTGNEEYIWRQCRMDSDWLKLGRSHGKQKVETENGSW